MEDAGISKKRRRHRQSGFQHTDRPRSSSPELFNKDHNAGRESLSHLISIVGNNRCTDFLRYSASIRTYPNQPTLKKTGRPLSLIHSLVESFLSPARRCEVITGVWVGVEGGAMGGWKTNRTSRCFITAYFFPSLGRTSGLLPWQLLGCGLIVPGSSREKKGMLPQACTEEFHIPIHVRQLIKPKI